MATSVHRLSVLIFAWVRVLTNPFVIIPVKVREDTNLCIGVHRSSVPICVYFMCANLWENPGPLK